MGDGVETITFALVMLLAVVVSGSLVRMPLVPPRLPDSRKVCERPLRQLRLSWSPLTSRHADRHIDFFLSQRPLQSQLKQKSDERDELVL